MDRQTVKRVVLASAIGLIVFFLFAACLFVISKVNKINYQESVQEDIYSPVPTLQQSVQELPTDVEAPQDDDILNVLLLGTDYKIEGTSDIGRADTNLIASLNKKTGDIKLISIERGIYVPIPEGLMPYGQTTDILTHAYRWGGAELSQSLVSTLFNIDLAGYAQVDINGFEKVVDAIGGVDVEISYLEAIGLNGGYGASGDQMARHTMYEGINHFDGHDAVCLCRLRSIDSDWKRVERQRRVLSAIINKTKTLSFAELNSLADTLLPMINTNLSKDNVVSVLLRIPFILKDINIEQMTVPDANMNDNHYIACDFDYESKKISNFIYGTDYELNSPY